MRRTRIGAAALLAGAMLAGCEGLNRFPDDPLGQGDTDLGSIRGTVTAAGQGVQGAEVSVANGPSAFTDAAGQYRIFALAPGVYRVTLGVPPGFRLAAGDSATRTATVVAGSPVVVNWQILTTVGGP